MPVCIAYYVVLMVCLEGFAKCYLSQGFSWLPIFLRVCFYSVIFPAGFLMHPDRLIIKTYVFVWVPRRLSTVKIHNSRGVLCGPPHLRIRKQSHLGAIDQSA